MGFDKAKAVGAAEKFLAQGKIPAAIQEYRRIVDAEANDFSALNTLGDLYSRVNKTEDAINCFARVAHHYREQGFALKAIAMFKKISRLNAETLGVAHELATLYEQQGLVVEARAQYLKIADACTRAGQTREALDALRRIADLDPHNYDIRLRLAQSYAQEGMPEEAVEAYVAAGSRMLTRHDASGALDSFNQAHALNPHHHGVLKGLIDAHAALGTADKAAALVEQAVAEWPGDVELRAMLAHAYLKAQDAPAAERAADHLLSAETSSYPLLFDVARLYLQQGYSAEAIAVLTRVMEPALAGKQEGALLGLLNQVLEREPQQIDALRLQLRIYSWQRDDERTRELLERLIKEARAQGLMDEERRALQHLVRLSPLDQNHLDRLEELGGAEEAGELFEEAPAPVADEPAVFEHFAPGGMPEVAFDSSGAAAEHAGEFEWNSVAASAAPTSGESLSLDPNSSFADLNEDFGAVAPAGEAQDVPVTLPMSQGFFATTSGEEEGAGAEERIKQLLAQELESVDFYLAQGYIDIARDTLNMLERQYGAQPAIASRRHQLDHLSPADARRSPLGAAEPAAAVADDNAYVEFTSFDIPAADSSAVADESQLAGDLVIESVRGNAPSAKESMPQDGAPAPAGIDAGLAEIFDEFRTAVEEAQPVSAEDYETHYNLGLAYKEMDLLDEAVEEFQTAIGLSAPQDGTPRYLQCCNLLGHCFMQKGMPRPAAMWYQKGLEAPGHSEDEYQALRYELATAYEQMGELDRAIELFSEVYGVNISYRGVADKLRELQARRAVTSEK